MSQPTLILASSSTYRAELLTRLNLVFSTVSPDIDESHKPNETPAVLVQRLACAKAYKIAETHPNAVIIGSDQVAVIDGKILGKSGTHEKAVQQLQQISGKTVTFHTGLCVHDGRNQNTEVDDIQYQVIMRQLQIKEIERYLHTERPYHCAGSFKSEGLGISLFERMLGDDPTALIGLPLIRLSHILRNAGFLLP